MWRLLFLALISTAANQVAAETVRVYAAVSLTHALQEIASVYDSTTGDHVVFNFAASNVLAQQIQAGAPADAFVSADETKMDGLEKRGLLLEGTRRSLLSNQLVIIVNTARPAPVTRPEDLTATGIRRLALADPDIVPAGIYAKAYLRSRGLWRDLTDKIIPTEDVRAALVAVESGNVDAGIVYTTDAAISKRVRIAYVVPVAEGPPISYPVAALRSGRNPEGGRRFAAHLASEGALSVFRAHGFRVVDPVATTAPR